jgi:Protein of unknown function (DUF2905)
MRPALRADASQVAHRNAAPKAICDHIVAECFWSGNRSMRQWLIAIGVVLVFIGVLWPWLTKLGLGRLPGDIIVEHGNLSFYFPIVTFVIISIVLSLIFWLLNR